MSLKRIVTAAEIWTWPGWIGVPTAAGAANRRS
jgi:hypothetical protein